MLSSCSVLIQNEKNNMMRFDFSQINKKRLSEKIKLINDMQVLIDDPRLYSENVKINDDQGRADISYFLRLCNEQIDIIKDFNIKIKTSNYQEEMGRFNLVYKAFQVYRCKIKLHQSFFSLKNICFDFFNEIAEDFDIKNDINNYEQSLRDLIYLHSICCQQVQKIKALNMPNDIDSLDIVWSEILNHDLIHTACCKIYRRIELHDNIIILHRDFSDLEKRVDKNIDFPEDLSVLVDKPGNKLDDEPSEWDKFICPYADNDDIFYMQYSLSFSREELSNMSIDRDKFEKFLEHPNLGYDEGNDECLASTTNKYKEAEGIFLAIKKNISPSSSEDSENDSPATSLRLSF